MTLARRPWDPQLGPLQVATLRRALEREGMVTAWWSDLPGARMAEHAHAFPETRWVVEGFLRITAGAEAVDLGPGDRLDLPPNLPHTIEVLGLAQAIYVSGMPGGSIIQLDSEGAPKSPSGVV